MKYLEAKSFFQNLLEKECEKENIDTTIFSTGRLSYFNSDYFKKKMKKELKIVRSKNSMIKRINAAINSIQLLMLPTRAGGLYDYSNNSLIVFLNDIGSPVLNNDITTLLYTTYHELHHALYYKNKKDSFDTSNFDIFACNLENFLSKHSSEVNIKYYFQHDSFMHEILASQYGIAKAGEYINGNPNAHHYNMGKLNRLKNRFQKKYKNYNLSYFLEIIIQNYRDCLKTENFDKSLFEIFLNDDGSFKDISNIPREQLQHIDSKIITAFVNTPSYLKANGEQLLHKNSISEREEVHSKKK